jgi:hypothetical protein
LSKSQSRLASLLKPHVPGPKTNWKLVPVATIAYIWWKKTERKQMKNLKNRLYKRLEIDRTSTTK